MKKGILLVITTLVLLNSGCVILFMPKKQNVSVASSNKESKIYVEDELQGKGTARFKTPKTGAKQVVIQTPGYKDNYFVMTAHRRQPGFWVCIGADVIFVPTFYGIYSLIFDLTVPKGFAYDKDNKFNLTGKINTKSDGEKYIDITNIGVDLKKAKDVNIYYINVNSDNQNKKIEKLMDEAEAKKATKDLKDEKKGKKKDLERLKKEEDATQYDDTKFSYNVYKTLKDAGYVDTVNKVFQDRNNTMSVEGKITKLSIFKVTPGKTKFSLWNSYYKSRISITWYIKNNFGEQLDSINVKDVSGDFVLYNYLVKSTRTDENQTKQVNTMVGDAIDNSFQNLYLNSTFKKYLKTEAVVEKTKEAPLKLNKPQSVVQEKSDAADAAVIIKRKDKGHGSGFAVTQDGYIITNYHVIASKDANQTEPVTAILSNGNEVEAKVVKFDKTHDVALLKVEKKFDKAFLLNNTKQYKKLEDVYTIGAPKSIELGQTVTVGIISNDRNSNNNDLIQLSMAVNSGNSGGPLFNAKGILHGVIVSKLKGESTEGIAFAIPAYKLTEYLNITY